MRFFSLCCLVLMFIPFAVVPTPASNCIPFSEARDHIGKTQCVSGTVVRVQDGNGAVTFLDFCESYLTCPFTVIVFRSDLKQVGDVRQLQGHRVEIKGTIQNYDGRAEIVLRRTQQLGKDAALVPALPKDYDVERRGQYSAGKFTRPKQAKQSRRKKGQAVGIEEPENP